MSFILSVNEATVFEQFDLIYFEICVIYSWTLSSESCWSGQQTNRHTLNELSLFAWWDGAMCGKDHWQNAWRFVGLLFCEFRFRGEWFGIAFGSNTHQTTGYRHIRPVSISANLKRTRWKKKNTHTQIMKKKTVKRVNKVKSELPLIIVWGNELFTLWNGYRSLDST